MAKKKDFMNPDWGRLEGNSNLLGDKLLSSNTRHGLAKDIDSLAAAFTRAKEDSRAQRPGSEFRNKPANGIIIHAEKKKITEVYDPVVAAASANMTTVAKKSEIIVVYCAVMDSIHPCSGFVSMIERPRGPDDLERIYQFPRFYTFEDFGNTDYPSWAGRACTLEVTDPHSCRYGIFHRLIDDNNSLISSKMNPYEDAKAKEAWDQTTSTTKTIEETQDGQGLSRDADGSAKGHSSPAGQGTQVFDSDLEGTVTEYRGIIHNLTGEKKNVTHHLIDNFYAMGIKNINVIYGTIATSGKESNFRLISEGGSYSWSLIKRKGWKTNSDGTIKRFNMAVPNRVLHRLRQQNKAYGYPSESLIQQIVTNPAWWKKLVFRSGLPAGVALFNIAYGYGRANWTEKLTLAKYKVVDQSGNINESLHNAGLAGWKYRGRGSIQTTFEEGYRKMSYAAGKLLGGPAEGEKWKKMVLANPDLVGSDARLATAMSAVQVIKRLSGMEKNYLGGRQAQNELEGIKMGVLAAFGPGNGGRDKGYGWDRAYGNAIKKAKKHLRIKKATTPVA